MEDKVVLIILIAIAILCLLLEVFLIVLAIKLKRLRNKLEHLTEMLKPRREIRCNGQQR